MKGEGEETPALELDLAAAAEKWPQEGIPTNPRAWLVSTGRFKAIDTLRRRTRFDASLADLASKLHSAANSLEITRICPTGWKRCFR